MDMVFFGETNGYFIFAENNGYRFFGESNGDGAAARKVYTYVCDQSLYIRLRSSTKHKQHNQYKHDALRCLLSTAAFGGQKSVYIRLRSKFIHTFTINKISKKSNLWQI